MLIRPVHVAALGFTSLFLAIGCDHPPEIDRILLSQSSLRSDESAVLSVTVHDKSGLGDIVGVQLFSEDLGFWYGSLPEVSDGIFETQINWGRLQQAAPINFDYPIERVVTVVAEDNEGGTDSVQVTLELRCRVKEHACDGACYPVELDCKDL